MRRLSGRRDYISLLSVIPVLKHIHVRSLGLGRCELARSGHFLGLPAVLQEDGNKLSMTMTRAC